MTDVPGLCGDPTCDARVALKMLLPGDDGISAPCDRCSAAMVAAMSAAQVDRLKAWRS